MGKKGNKTTRYYPKEKAHYEEGDIKKSDWKFTSETSKDQLSRIRNSSTTEGKAR